MSQMAERQKPLSRLLTQAALGPGAGEDRPPLLAGCYLAATGRKAATEQAFVRGVFDRLLKQQSAVAWERQAKEDDQRYQRWARQGEIALGVVGALLFLGLAYALLF
jgi:hypothetical protein